MKTISRSIAMLDAVPGDQWMKAKTADVRAFALPSEQTGLDFPELCHGR